MNSGFLLTDEQFGQDEEAYAESFFDDVNPIVTNTQSLNLYFSDDDLAAAKLSEGLPFTLKPAYDTNGNPNYFDSTGALVEGIYLGIPNDVYHALPAISSSHIKKYAKSPAHYYRQYINKIDRSRQSKAQVRTLSAGTLSHELILEPDGFHNRYFRLLNPMEIGDCLVSLEQLKEACGKAKLPVSGTKTTLTERLLKHDPTIKIFDDLQKAHIITHVGQDAYDKAIEVQSSLFSRVNIIDCLFHDSVLPHLKMIPVDPIVWDDAHRACETVKSHSFASAILEDGFAEVSVIVRCPETGEMLKVRFDWLSRTGIPADLKTARTADPFQAGYQFADMGYDLQAYMYSYVGRLAGIPCPENVFPFIVVEYAEADICEVFELDDDDWEIAAENFHRYLAELCYSKEDNFWAGYTRNDQGSSILKLPKRGRANAF